MKERLCIRIEQKLAKEEMPKSTREFLYTLSVKNEERKKEKR